MRLLKSTFGILGCAAVLFGAALEANPQRANVALLTPVADYVLPGRATRWDYQSFDAESAHLYIAHLGDSSVVVVDVKSGRVVSEIRDVAAAHGVLVVPQEHRLYVSATRTHEVVVIDLESLQLVARVPGGAYPDGMAYVPDARKLYVSDENGRAETVIDTRTNRRVATIPLGGEVGNSQYDPISRHVFVNVQGTHELGEIDPTTDAVVARSRLPGAGGNHGLLIEPTSRLAFIACEDNDTLLLFDLETRKVVNSFKTGGGPDVLAYDPGLGLLYVASESGPVSMFSVRGKQVRKLGDVNVGANAHSVAVNPTTHETYFPLKGSGSSPVLRVMRPT